MHHWSAGPQKVRRLKMNYAHFPLITNEIFWGLSPPRFFPLPRMEELDLFTSKPTCKRPWVREYGK